MRMMLFLYLAKRNKSQIKLLAVLNGAECQPMRIDVKRLSLPSTLTDKLDNYIYQERMLWEPWIESATNYPEFVRSLQRRGFSKLPLCAKPLFEPQLEKIISAEKAQQKIVVNLPTKSSMLRRKKN